MSNQMENNFGTAPELAEGWLDSVVDYHRLTYSVVAEARRVATGRFALCSRSDGFGTPPFTEDDRSVWVSGDQICMGTDAAATCEPITTLRAGAEFVGIPEPGTTTAEHDSPELGDIDAQLKTSVQVGEALSWWFTLGDAVLRDLEAIPGAQEPEGVNLWPGHLDIATAVGVPASRATYGLSPGDHSHSEPYVYVGAWVEVDRSDEYWNDENFSGASLPYRRLLGMADPAEMVREFLRTGYDKLTALSQSAD